MNTLAFGIFLDIGSNEFLTQVLCVKPILPKQFLPILYYLSMSAVISEGTDLYIYINIYCMSPNLGLGLFN